MVALCFRLFVCLVVFGAQDSRIRGVEFEDNRTFSDFTLAREVVLSTGELFSEEQADADARAVEAFYKNNGFDKTKVTTEFNWLWPKKLVFHVREGKGPTVKRMRFKGEPGFSDSRLKGIIGTELNRLYEIQKVSEDSNHLVSFYKHQGYPWAAIAPEYDSTKRRLTFTIIKGKRLKIEEIRFVGVPGTDTGMLKRLIPLKRNKPVTVLALQETLMATARYFRDKGYYYVDVSLEQSVKGRDVSLSIKVTPGKKAVISSISFTGVDPSRIYPGFLLRTTRLKPGEFYSVSRVDRAGKLLYATYLFNRVRVDFDTIPQDSLDLVFSLDPAKARIVSFGFGLQTAGKDELDGKSELWSIIPDRLSLSLGWEHLNLFKRGVGFSTEMIYNPTFRGDYETELNIRNRYPNFLPWGLALTISPYWKHGFYKIDSEKNYHILGAEAGLDRYFSDRLRTGLSIQIRKILVGASEEQTNFLRASMVYDSRDDFFSPTSGVYFFPYADWAGTPLGGSNNFVRMAADFRNYLALPLDIVLVWRAHGGFLIPHSGERYEDISFFEKFTIGGAGSLRAIDNKVLGPDIDTITVIDTTIDTIDHVELVTDTTLDTTRTFNHYGSLLFLYSFEIRTPYISDLLGFVLFFDIGLCERSLDNIGDNWTWGPGVGVRVKTPIGPVRLDISKDARTPFDTSHWLYGARIDIGFLQAF